MRLPALSLVPHLLLSSALAAVQVTLPADIPEKCVASCNTFKRVVSACPAATPDCLCTVLIEHIGYACARCVSTKATYPQQQRELDAWLAECKAAGHPLPPLTFPAPGKSNTTSTTVPRRPATTSTPAAVPLTTPGRTVSIPATTRGVGRGTTTTPLSRSTSRTLPTASQVVYRGSAAPRRTAASLVAVALVALCAVALPRL